MVFTKNARTNSQYFQKGKRVSSDQEHSDDNGSDNSLAQVRELLFGVQSRDFDERCNQLQQQMEHSFDSLRNDISTQLGQLKKVLQDEIANVRGQVTGEQAERKQQIDQLQSTLDERIVSQGNELQSRIGGVNDELRAYTLNQTQHLWDDLQSRYDNLSSRLDEEVNSVRDAAAHRSSLGDMFREMATRLEEHSQAEQR